jgi:endonuclease-3
MATTTNKQKLFNHLLAAPAKPARGGAAEETRPVLEQFVYAVCREEATRESADRAFKNLREQFYDWNEVRVSSEQEVADALDGHLSEPVERAKRIIGFLQEVFETDFAFDLEPLQKKGLKQAAKQLSRYQASSDYAVAWVVQQSLGGHALPLDARAVRVLRRLGLLEEEQTDLEAMRASLEHQVPKVKGLYFVDAVSEVAESHCWENDPACPMCPLRHTCVTGASAKTTMSSTSKKPR